MMKSIIIDNNDKPEDTQEQNDDEIKERGLFEKVFENLQECFKNEIGEIEVEEEKTQNGEKKIDEFEVIDEEQEFNKLVDNLQDDF